MEKYIFRNPYPDFNNLINLLRIDQKRGRVLIATSLDLEKNINLERQASPVSPAYSPLDVHLVEGV
jgi:hypothetical protein